MAGSGQGLVSSTPAKLQAYFLKSDGSEVMISCDNLAVNYNQLKMTGEVNVKAFVVEDEDLKALMDQSELESVSFSSVLPDGQFASRDNYNNLFTSEAEITAGDYISKLILNFDVSNRNSSLTNTFAITCTGSLNLQEHLGLTAGPHFSDKVSFLFFQNVRVLNY